jgi:ribosomal silencing factor RsfS
MNQQNLNFRTRPLIDELKEADKRRQLKSQHYQDRTRLEWMLRDFGDVGRRVKT